MLEQVDTSSFLIPGNKMLYEIYKDRDGKLWVSAFDMESFIIDIRKHFIKKYTLPALREQIKANPAIISLCMDSKGVFWFSQERYGLYVYDAGTDRMGYYLRNGGTKNLPLWEVRNLIPSHVPGGASKAVYHGLKNLGIESIFVSRTHKADDMLIYEELTPEIMAEYTVIVNSTPVGMFPKVDFCPNIPYELLTPNHLLYDLLYNPNVTLFMKKGEAQGAVVKNGLEMLLLQAFAAWEIWHK